MMDQFGVIDCLQLSRGLQILHEMRYRYFIPSDLAVQIVQIENVLNCCAKRHTEKDNLTLSDINCIIRTYNNRKCEYLFLTGCSKRFVNIEIGFQAIST